MMTPQTIWEIIDANGGRLVGKTRLQKSAYLLEALDLGTGFSFDYHYYGPYSDELSQAAEDAKTLGLIDVNWDTTQTGLEFAIYTSSRNSKQSSEALAAKRRDALRVLEHYDSISLELAATAHFLSQSGHGTDAWTETRRRKSVKATPDRVAKAQRLLDELGLSIQST